MAAVETRAPSDALSWRQKGIKEPGMTSTNSPSSLVHQANETKMTRYRTMLFASGFVALAAFAAALVRAAGNASAPFALPPQSVFVSPLSIAVQNITEPRNSTTPFNPTNTSLPFFQIFDAGFLSILGSSPSLHLIASNSSFAFAHEAPVWVEETNELFFASNDGGALGFSDINHNSKVGMINLDDVEQALQAQNGTGDINTTVTELDLPDSIQMTNGGTGPYNGSLLLVTSGRGPLPPSIAMVNPSPPFNTTVLLDNFFGRQFNSLNDIKILNGKFFFTDPDYGWWNQFRPLPELPTQVYTFDPLTGIIRVVADGFVASNGLAFDKTGKTAYVTDTGFNNGVFGNNETRPATIYAFDVAPKTGVFINRRTFAYVDTGVPDGIQVDSEGNVYSGCGDGVQVWDSSGTLLGKFFLGTTSANMVFAAPGQLLILAETAIYMAKIAAKGNKLSFP